MPDSNTALTDVPSAWAAYAAWAAYEILALMTFILGFCTPAHAADGLVAVDLTGIAIATVSGVFSILGAVLLAIIQAKIKNAQMSELLAAAVKNSLGKIQQATIDQVRQAEFLHPEMSPGLAVGVEYVARHAPEALAHFGVTPEAVADKVTSAIGLKNLEANIAIAGSSLETIPQPLGPVPASPPGTTAQGLNNAELERLKSGPPGSDVR